MKVKLCYKDLKIGELTYDGDKYEYVSLPDRSKFLKEYGYIDFPLASIKSKKSREMPYFFAEFVERLIYNPAMSTKLNINLNVGGTAVPFRQLPRDYGGAYQWLRKLQAILSFRFPQARQPLHPLLAPHSASTA